MIQQSVSITFNSLADQNLSFPLGIAMSFTLYLVLYKLNLTTGTGRNLSTRKITEQTRQDVHVIETVVVLFCLFVWFFVEFHDT